jgi:uncharacterized protein (DUF697 family)
MLSVAAVTCTPPKTHPAGRDRTVLSHAALVALTPLIPLPFVDEVAKNRLQRRMVRMLAQSYDLLLQPADLALLADDRPGNVAGSIVKGLVFTPLRQVLRKTFMILAGNKIAEVASSCYHRGFLIERAFARGLCAPDGPQSVDAVRQAIDEVMAEVPVASSPVTAALRAGLLRSQDAFQQLSRKLRARLTGLGRQPAQATVDQAMDDETVEADPALDGIVAQLRHALNEVPARHFDDLEHSLCRKLGRGD